MSDTSFPVVAASSEEVSNQEDTKQRILDAALELFSETGFAATSLRAITAKAEANLAAVNYHFGSKDNLIAELVSRGIRDVNAERIRRLGELEQEYADKPVPVEFLLEAFLIPVFVFCKEEKNRPFLSILCRAHNEPGEFYQIIMKREWHPLTQRFFNAFHKTVPSLNEDVLFWRMHFMVGAMIHTLTQFRGLTILSEGTCTFDNPDFVIEQFIRYNAAGLLQGTQEENKLSK